MGSFPHTNHPPENLCPQWNCTHLFVVTASEWSSDGAFSFTTHWGDSCWWYPNTWKHIWSLLHIMRDEKAIPLAVEVYSGMSLSQRPAATLIQDFIVPWKTPFNSEHWVQGSLVWWIIPSIQEKKERRLWCTDCLIFENLSSNAG
jgi:hypothetical protein